MLSKVLDCSGSYDALPRDTARILTPSRSDKCFIPLWRLDIRIFGVVISKESVMVNCVPLV